MTVPQHGGRVKFCSWDENVLDDLEASFSAERLGTYPGGRIGGTGRKANYEMTLWRPALRRAFPHRSPLTRKQAHRPLNDLRRLRNRIAHHEPIFARGLLADHQRILDVTGWISPSARSWIEGHSRVAMLLDALNYGTDVHF